MRLEGGIVRRIHVSRKRITTGHGRPIIIEQPEPEGRAFAAGVKIEGPSEIFSSRRKIEGGANVYIETNAPLIVSGFELDQN